ncbi:DUF6262 family protein [Saccharopolyspora sp. K220]|uniref:DUF6262 family protein n=1 Tax=Saccharopolyspora soli TaxID=2926618 RepID=UPI001F5A3184|nr:DUF6262 family protein [Saccharopolyspora soli]MCI2421149.1 DUF6262 family protein [Saccharopolyspora soli]
MPQADNTRFLLAATQRRSAEARNRAEQALASAAKSTKPITVAGIAKAAKVSRSWLYTQADLIDAITHLQQRQPSPARTGQQPATIASLQNRLDAANRRNKQLRSQVADLTERLETAYGEIRALRNARPNN